MEKAKSKIKENLRDIYPENELNSMLRLLLSKISGMNYTNLIRSKNTIFSDNQREELDLYLQRLKKMEPLQYVLGETEFYGLPMVVNSNVLIPRPETEELVEWVLKDAKRRTLNILDVGTGSACIPIALKKNIPEGKLIAIDVSGDALEVATLNANLNQVKIEFYQEDALDFSTEFLDHFNLFFDVIVSNPPYIPASEIVTIHQNVKNFEPHSALFVPNNDPLLFYREIASSAKLILKEEGMLYFEIHRDFGFQCVEMLQQQGYVDVELRKDIFGNYRLI